MPAPTPVAAAGLVNRPTQLVEQRRDSLKMLRVSARRHGVELLALLGAIGDGEDFPFQVGRRAGPFILPVGKH